MEEMKLKFKNENDEMKFVGILESYGYVVNKLLGYFEVSKIGGFGDLPHLDVSLNYLDIHTGASKTLHNENDINKIINEYNKINNIIKELKEENLIEIINK